MKKHYCDVCGKEVLEKELREIKIADKLTDGECSIKLKTIEGCKDCIEFIQKKQKEFYKIIGLIHIEFSNRLLGIRKR